MPDPSPTILCVDDDPEVLEILHQYLTALGYRVITATNGVEAFLQAWQQRPRAVILDLFMPRLGGLGALHRIRRLDPNIAVVIMSGIENAVEIVTEAGVAVAGALAKPFDLSHLLGVLVEAGVLPARTLPGGAPAEESPGGRPAVRRRVLVVDDEVDVRDVLIEYLEAKGFEAVGAASGEEALERLPAYRPDIVLLDINMPGLSGLETLRKIKALPQETCVVMASGQGDEEVARRALVLGAADYIRKPLDLAYVEAVLETHCLMSHL